MLETFPEKIGKILEKKFFSKASVKNKNVEIL